MQAIETGQGSGNEAVHKHYKMDQNGRAGVNCRYQDGLGMRLRKCYIFEQVVGSAHKLLATNMYIETLIYV